MDRRRGDLCKNLSKKMFFVDTVIYKQKSPVKIDIASVLQENLRIGNRVSPTEGGMNRL